MAVSANGDVYAVAEYTGRNIYKQAGGSGNFVSLGQADVAWRHICVAPNGDIYATAYGDIYKQTGGSGNFVALGQSQTPYWEGITAAPNGDIYCAAVGVDIYKQTGGAGNFVALSQGSYGWGGMATEIVSVAPILSGSVGPGPRQNTLSWGAVGGADSYNLYRSTSPGVTVATGTLISGVTSPYLDTGLLDATTYYYAATSVAGGVESDLSNEVSLTTLTSLEGSLGELAGQCRLSIYLNEETDAFDVFSQINAAVGSYLFNDHLGKYRYVAYMPPTGASVVQFTEEDMDSFTEEVDATKIISKVKAKYAHRVSQDYWQVRFANRASSQYLKGAAAPIQKEIEYPFVLASDGLKGAQRAVLHEGVPQRIYKCRVSSKGWTLLPSNFIQVTYTRHAVNGIFEVLETKRNLETGKVDLVIGSLRGLVSGGTSGGFGYPGHWTEEAPVFPSSLGGGSAETWDINWTADQKAYAKQNFGYWCDANGFADPDDPESYLCSTWI